MDIKEALANLRTSLNNKAKLEQTVQRDSTDYVARMSSERAKVRAGILDEADYRDTDTMWRQMIQRNRDELAESKVVLDNAAKNLLDILSSSAPPANMENEIILALEKYSPALAHNYIQKNKGR